MSYIEDFERDFRAFIEENLPVLPEETEAALVSVVKLKVVESYRNGMAATERARAVKKKAIAAPGNRKA